MNKLMDIAQLVRRMKDQTLKGYITNRWVRVEDIALDEMQSGKLIEAICLEDKELIERMI